MISKTFCILPWIHLSTRPNGHLRLCCTANASSADATNDKKFGGEIGILKDDDGKPSNLGHHDIFQAWNNNFMRSVRRMMLEGKIPHPCVKCFKEEAAGHNSKRIWETEYWSNYIDVNELIKNTNVDGSIPTEIPYLDLRFGTKCDLKCIMCSPHDSSMWIGDWAKMYPQIKNESLKELCQWNNKGRYDGASYTWYKDNPNFIDQLYDQIPHMKQLYFAGGEALIIKEYNQLLQAVVDMGYADQITLRYNSNGIRLTDEHLNLWSKFKRVRFHFSIDSIENMNSYIRWPSKWDDITKQLKRLDETPDNIEITIACAVQLLNIYYIPNLVQWKLEQNFKKINPWPLGGGLVNYHLVYHPAFLNVKVLPQWFKDEVSNKYNMFYDWLKQNYRTDNDFVNSSYGLKRYKGLINFMNSEDWSNRMPEFREYITLLDNIRKTNFSETFPEMVDLLL
jgi:hypothetical protein